MVRDGAYDMASIVKNHDIVFLVFDTLRYDLAQQCFGTGSIPVIG
jgi:hypothetical protein